MEVSSDKIIIPINSKVIIKVQEQTGTLEGFELLSNESINKPLSTTELTDEFRKIVLAYKVISDEIEFHFSHTYSGDSFFIVLTTVHRLGKSIIFKAKIKTKGKKAYKATSIVPIYSNVISRE